MTRVDLVGATARHDLQTVASLAGLPLEALKDGESVLEATERQAAERLRFQGQLVAKRVDLFRRRPMYRMRRDEDFVLGLGDDGWMVLSPAPASTETAERWDVRHVRKEGGYSVVASDLSMAYAQGFAEDRARTAGAGGLVNPHAKWRKASVRERPKMTALLAKWGVPMPADMTVGEAADVISLELLARAERRGSLTQVR